MFDIVGIIRRIGVNLIGLLVDFGRALSMPMNDLQGGILLGGYNFLGVDIVFGPLLRALLSIFNIDLDTITLIEFIPIMMVCTSIFLLVGRIIDVIIDLIPDGN